MLGFTLFSPTYLTPPPTAPVSKIPYNQRLSRLFVIPARRFTFA